MGILKTKSICIYQVTPRILKKFKGIVSRMHCSLYGLKQAPRAQFDQFHQTVKKAEFQQSGYDPSMSLHPSSTELTLLLVYIDDNIITGNNPDSIHHLQQFVHSSFHMKDLGNHIFPWS